MHTHTHTHTHTNIHVHTHTNTHTVFRRKKVYKTNLLAITTSAPSCDKAVAMP